MITRGGLISTDETFRLQFSNGGKKRRGDSDLLSQVIGICEGPSDLAERHDKYIYGDK